MKKLSSQQTDFFAKIELSIRRLPVLEAEARRLNLPILEKLIMTTKLDWSHHLELQARAFRDDTLCDPEPLYPQGQFPYGRKDNNVR
jgi:hypothetical protein